MLSGFATKNFVGKHASDGRTRRIFFLFMIWKKLTVHPCGNCDSYELLLVFP